MWFSQKGMYWVQFANRVHASGYRNYFHHLLGDESFCGEYLGGYRVSVGVEGQIFSFVMLEVFWMVDSFSLRPRSDKDFLTISPLPSTPWFLLASLSCFIC